MRKPALRGQVTPGHPIILLVESRLSCSPLLAGSAQTSSPANRSVQAVDGLGRGTEAMKTDLSGLLPPRKPAGVGPGKADIYVTVVNPISRRVPNKVFRRLFNEGPAVSLVASVPTSLDPVKGIFTEHLCIQGVQLDFPESVSFS